MENKIINELVLWIKEYVNNAHAKGVVIGMSGGKDSFIVAKLCTLALGKDNVFGLILPNGKMSDLNDAINSCNILDMSYKIINIKSIYSSIIKYTKKGLGSNRLSDVTTINISPRIRMTMLYSFAGSLNYLVANTSNLSEAMVGYTTKWGDNVGDFAPIANFTKSEVCEIGLMLGLPEQLVNKIPSDGLSKISDEDKLGFSYAELDTYIRNGVKGKNFDKIEQKHRLAKHKINPIVRFDFDEKNYFYKENNDVKRRK